MPIKIRLPLEIRPSCKLRQSIKSQHESQHLATLCLCVMIDSLKFADVARVQCSRRTRSKSFTEASKISESNAFFKSSGLRNVHEPKTEYSRPMSHALFYGKKKNVNLASTCENKILALNLYFKKLFS